MAASSGRRRAPGQRTRPGKESVNAIAKAKQAWRALSAEEKNTLLLTLLHRRHAQWEELAEGVVSVGVGRRLRRSKRHREQDERAASLPPEKRKGPRLGDIVRGSLCIRFVVQTKAPKGMPLRRPVPRFIIESVKRRNRRLTVAIPTDVEQLCIGGTLHHGPVDLTDGIVTRSPGIGATGCFAAVLKAVPDDGRRFLLTCDHVLSFSDQPHGPRDDAVVFDRRSAALGVFHERVGFTGGLGNDAATALLNQPIDARMWGIRPRDYAGPLDALSPLRVFVPRDNGVMRDGPIPAKFIDRMVNYPFNLGGEVVRATHVIRYRADTIPGDSGSALIKPSRILCGMHFYKQDDGICLAVPAWLIFSDNFFGQPVQL